MLKKTVPWEPKFGHFRVQKSTLVIAGAIAVLAVVSMGVHHPAGFSATNHTIHSAAGANQGFTSGALQGALPEQAAPPSNADASATSVSAPSTVQSTSASPSSVIEQASLTITTKDVKQATERVNSFCATSGGFVQSEQTSENDGTSTVWLTARIPETHFQRFLTTVQTFGKVTNFSQTGRDVTQQIEGLQENLQELHIQADAYTRLYNRAQTMHDMLQIEQALSQVNGQIADLSGQEHNIRRQVQLAAVSLSFQTAAANTNSSTQSPLVSAFDRSLRTLEDSAVGLITVIAWLLPWCILTFIAVWAWRLVKRRLSSNPNN